MFAGVALRQGVQQYQQNLENLRRNHFAPIRSVSPSVTCRMMSYASKEQSDAPPQKPLSR